MHRVLGIVGLAAGVIGCGDSGGPSARRLQNAIVFTSVRNGQQQLYLMSPPGAPAQALTVQPGVVGSGAPSPDGRRVALSWKGDIYVLTVASGALEDVTNSAGTDSDPDWSPDGARIVFLSNRAGANPDLYTMRADGTDVQRITTTTTGSDTVNLYPRWSPDGSRIAFTMFVGSSDSGDIYVVRPDGTDRIRLTQTAGADRIPAWSRDGTRILFSSDREGVSYLYMMNADGSNPHRVGQWQATPADWSPDDSRLLIVTSGPASSDIFTVDTDGTNPVNLTHDAYLDVAPRWAR